MSAFFQDLAEHGFLQSAVIACVLASLSCGMIGSYVVVRRNTYIAGAIAHCVLGGMGLARYLERVHGVAWMTPLVGATLAAVVAALVIGVVTLRSKERMDTVLSAIWAIGMAIGISFIAATPGYSDDLMSYLFGNILMVAKADLWLMGWLNLIVIGLGLLFYNKFLAISFNERTARLRGIRVEIYELLFLLLTALAIVLLVKVVGIVLVIALLTLPAATAGMFARRLSGTILLAVGISLVCTIGGLAISYQPDWPPGATIIEVTGVIYLVGAAITYARKKKVAGN